MKILSRIYNFFFRTSSSNDFEPREEEIEEAKQVANQSFEIKDQEEVAEQELEDEKVNTETCEICGKVFEGEHAAQKKGGHKASGHYN